MSRHSPPRSQPEPEHRVRPGTQVATFWLDESGGRATAGSCFVVGGIKTRRPDAIQRAIHAVRERNGDYSGEFKFSRISDGNVNRFYELIDVLQESDARLIATVVNLQEHNPFKSVPHWQAHSSIVQKLVIGGLNKNEIATVLIDGISSPPGIDLGGHIKRGVNSRLRTMAVTMAASLDSKSNDLLQAADLFAGAVSHQRRTAPGSDSAKARVARRLALAFEVPDLSDVHTRRLNVQTLQKPRRSGRRVRTDLHAVPDQRIS